MSKNYLKILLSATCMLLGVHTMVAQNCSTCASVTTFTVDLSANPDTSATINSSRNGKCCQGTGSDKCIVFNVTVSPKASEIRFIYKNGSANNGTYEINCDPATQQSPGTPQCLNGLTSFCITFCAPGGASDNYTITTSSGFAAATDVTLRGGCTGQLIMSGLLESTLSWTSVYPGAAGAYNAYLSCLTGCDTTNITPAVGAPAYIDYMVCGSRTGCITGNYCDTQRVYTVAPLTAAITPVTPVLCAGDPNPVLTATPTGGSAPYSYIWSSGDTTAAITATSGFYRVTVTDATACSSVKDSVTVSTQPAATCNAGADGVICAGSTYVLSGSRGGSATSSRWTSSGTGTFNNDSLLAATYTPSAADLTAGSVRLKLTTSGPCSAAKDSMVLTINPVATVNAGASDLVCSNSTYTLSGTRGGGASSSNWYTSGTGTFNNSALLNAIYTPSASDLSAGSVVLTLLTNDPAGPCPPVGDSLVLTFTPAPTVNAGADQIVCMPIATAVLSGSVTLAGGGSWSGGSGTFNPNNTILNATYTPTASEISAGFVNLVLTSTGNGGCNAVTDTMRITYTPSPSVNAGSDLSVCANNANVALTGTSNTSGGTWSSNGTGTFTPDANTLNATYNSSATDISNGSVRLILTSSNNGGCAAAKDTLFISFTTAPTANAGSNQTVCANNANISLSGSVTLASGGRWTSSGTGTFSPSDSSLNTTYIPSAADKTSGIVMLFLSTTGNGNCNTSQDTVLVTITPAPVANAGADKVACSNNTNVALNGTVTSATGGRWSTNGTGTFSPNDSTLNATYIYSAADSAAGTILLFLATIGNGNCAAVNDTLVLTIAAAPVTNAGSDQSVCANNASIQLNGSVVSSAGTGTWTTTGSGSFTPNTTSFNAIYNPGAADISAGQVTLILTPTGACTTIPDSMHAVITPAPVVNAGANLFICNATTPAALNGSVTGGSTKGRWTTSGTGSFTPNDSALNANYHFSVADSLAGNVTLLLTSTNNGNCSAVSDTVLITMSSAAAANAGNDTTVCANATGVQLTGTVTGGSGTGLWTSNGSGTYTPSATALNATYHPTAADISSGSIKLWLTSTLACQNTTDTMRLSFSPLPASNAGADQTLCAGDTVQLNGSVTNAAGGWWTTTGSGMFSPNDITLNAVYIPSLSDVTAGTVNLNLTTVGTGSCSQISDVMTVLFAPVPSVQAGSDISLCTTSPVPLNGQVTGAMTKQWSTLGSGTFTPNDSLLNAVYNPSASDVLAGNVTLVLHSVNTCGGTSSDTLVIRFGQAPTANAGNDLTACTTDSIQTGATASVNTTIQWTTSGTGTFYPDNATINARYVPSVDDEANGSVTLYLAASNSCGAASDSIFITLVLAPFAYASTDQTVCESSNVSLNPYWENANTFHWKTMGTGTFSPNDSDIWAVYVPSAADVDSVYVMLYMEVTNLCGTDVDSMRVTFTPTSYANAGPDQTICEGYAAQLNGAVYAATGTAWMTFGDGTFIPNAATLTPLYVPGPNDIANGIVKIRLRPLPTGNCNWINDSLYITITPAVNVQAGNDTTVCPAGALQLNAQVSGSNSMHWITRGDGSFIPNDSTLTAIYQPGAQDTVSGSVTLLLSAAGGCGISDDSLIVTYGNFPVADAGSNQAKCIGDSISLNGSVTGTSTRQWSASGGGQFIPNNSTLNAVYVPSIADIIAGRVTFTLNASNACDAVSDSMIATLVLAPAAYAGSDQSVCAGVNVSLSPVYSSANGFQWMTTGSGTFSPNDTDILAVYIPGASDLAAGNVTLYMTVVNSCSTTRDSVDIAFMPAPMANAGGDLVICSGAAVQLNGSISNTTGSQWTTSGNGAFIPDPMALNATYIPGSNDISSGTVTLVLHPVASGSCNPVNDTLTVDIQSTPVANFTSSTSCTNGDVVFTDASSVVNGTITNWNWTAGSFTSATQNPTFTNMPAGNHAVRLVASTAIGCADTVNGTIFVNPSPVASFGITTHCPDNAEFADSSTLSSGNIASWSWDFGDLSTSNSQNPTHVYSSIGDYAVQLTVTSDSGCTAVYTDTVHLEACPQTDYPDPSLPTAFTPNNDGHNDIFYVRGGPFDNLDFRVFNEWGNEVFQSDAQSSGWDGTYKNKAQAPGKYIWVVKGTTGNGGAFQLTGQFMLIR